VTVSGSDTILYDNEEHIAANLFDALKEGLYGNM
jgi:ribonucleoside-diphosphate reductase alpha chain